MLTAPSVCPRHQHICMALRFFAISFLFLLVLHQPVRADEEVSTRSLFHELATIERQIDWPGTAADVTRLRERMTKLQALARTLIGERKATLSAEMLKLDALGPPPEEKETESADVREQRARLNDGVIRLEGDMKQAELVLAEIEVLTSKLQTETVDRRIVEFMDPEPVIFSEEHWRLVQQALRTDGYDQKELPWWWRAMVLLAGLSGLFAGILRQTKVTSPSGRAPRIWSLLFLSAIIGGGHLYVSRNAGAFDPVAGASIMVALAALIGLTIGTLYRWIVDETDALAFTTEPDRQVMWVTFTALNLQMILALLGDPTPLASELTEFARAIIGLAAVAALVLLLMRSVRQTRSEGRIRKTLRERRLSRRAGWKRLIGPSEIAGIAMTLTFPVLYIMGYRDVGDWLLIGLVGSVMGLATLAFMTSTFETTASHLVRRWLRPGIALRLGNRVPARTERHLQFWVSTVMTLFAFLFIGGLIILAWGVEPSQIWLWFDGRMEGIEFGEFELHFISIFYALIALLVVLAISRGLQSLLERRLFDSIDLPLSGRSAIKSLIGYSGFAIGVLVFLMTLGIDLGNLAIVAGALSVGLGFGIQAIVGNFVSGILLLLERPLKVGDWVCIGDFEGKVRRISFRATEIETAERASVLVPNSSIISGAVLNRSFKDKLGRVELEIRTAANRSVSELREALSGCAHEVREFVDQPSPKVILSDGDTEALVFRIWAFMPFIDVADKRLAEGELRERIHDCLKKMDAVAPPTDTVSENSFV